jgi:CubicO group peptidase (beta-lactamase class C family)
MLMRTRLLVFVVLLFSLSSCYFFRAYKVRKFNLADHEKLPSLPVAATSNSFRFAVDTNTVKYWNFRTDLDRELMSSHTAAFLVIKNDTIIYERYFNGFGQESLLPSFSVVKSFVSTLIAVAIDEGKIRSLDDPVTLYLPELLKTDPDYSKITLRNLMDMKSGLDFNEDRYGLKDDAIKLAFRPNLLKYALKVKTKTEPGKTFRYQSINTEFLALVVERATGKKVSAYLQEKLWQPLGMEYNATWNVDSKKHQQEIAYAALNATARDFAKLGRLYLNNGNWNGEQILDPKWVRAVNNADSMDLAGGYRNQWWSHLRYRYFTDSLSAEGFRANTRFSTGIGKSHGAYYVGYRTDAFHAEGILNQYVYVNPLKNLVIVRLGRYWYHPNKWPDQFIYDLADVL